MEESSPAALAGLQPHTDYIVGEDQVLQDVRYDSLYIYFSALIYFRKKRRKILTKLKVELELIQSH